MYQYCKNPSTCLRPLIHWSGGVYPSRHWVRDRKTPSQGRNTDHTQSCMMGKSSDVTGSLPDLSNTTGAHFTPLCTARSCCSHPLQTTPGPFADLSLREKENQGDNKGQRHTQKKREIFLKPSINIHCIDVRGDFMSAVCQTGASVNKTPSARVGAHQSNISTRVRTPPLPVRSVRRGQQQLAAFTRFRVCERSRDDWIPPAFGTNPAKDKQATSVNNGPQDRCDGVEN